MPSEVESVNKKGVDAKDQLQLKPRVLVVDDSKVLRKAAEKILGKEFDVLVACDGEEGWEKVVVDEKIQIVFSDLSMPQLDGYGLLDRIRHSDNQRISDIPVIVITGGEAEEARRKALDMGATDFITKPFDTVNLLARAKAHSQSVQKNNSLQKQNESLVQSSTLDPLTALGNKDFFIEKLKQDRSFTSRHRLPLSILALDIDNYKQIFVKNGKPLAEGLVKQVARILNSQIRKEDTSARIGVSQLVVALPTATNVGAYRLAERLRSKVANSKFTYNGKKFGITVSVCISTPSAKEVKTADELLKETLDRLKQSMGEGRDTIVACQPLPMISDAEAQAANDTEAELNSQQEAIAKLSVQEAIALIEKGDREPVYKQLDHLLEELIPLLRMLSYPQRQSLIKVLGEK